MSLKPNIKYYGRFKDLTWFDSISKSRVMIFGQGGIGSHLTFFLARTGAEIITVDDDVVEVHNIAGQLYGIQDVGKPKVKAMESVIERLCGENKITPIQARVEMDVEGQWSTLIKSCDVVCVSFDNIKARTIVYDYWKRNRKEHSIFVDGRMSAQNGQVFTVQSTATEEDMKAYEATFFNDADIPEAPCTAKATTHCGSLIASLMVTQITNWFSNKREGSIPQTVVKQYDFHLPFMLFDQIK